MEDTGSERWKELCKQAAREQDSKKLTALVREIARLLEAKGERPRSPKSSKD
jgi:hypothetical protein